MTFLARYPDGRSQLLMFARRNFLQGLASAILPFISQPQSVFSAGRCKAGRCKPEFSIGDGVRASWEAEPGVFRFEHGEVCGICWHPVKQQWEYLIIWAGCDFDEYLTTSQDLELNHHA